MLTLQKLPWWWPTIYLIKTIFLKNCHYFLHVSDKSCGVRKRLITKHKHIKGVENSNFKTKIEMTLNTVVYCCPAEPALEHSYIHRLDEISKFGFITVLVILDKCLHRSSVIKILSSSWTFQTRSFYSLELLFSSCTAAYDLEAAIPPGESRILLLLG